MTGKIPALTRFFAALAVCASAPAIAAEPVSPLAGVWDGTIGTLPIRACFEQHERGNSGGYFYRSKRKFIGLSADADHAQYVEGAQSVTTAPRWTINPAAAGLEGTWSQGAKSLPIRLTRVAAPQADETACASMTFLQPRLDGIRNVTSHFVKDGVGFTRITVDLKERFEGSGQSTVQIDGTTPAARKINAELLKPFSDSPPAWLDCIEGSLDNGQSEGSSDSSSEPGLVTRRWLSVTNHSESYCGGAHPDSSSWATLFDRGTGDQVNLLDWFRPTAVKREGAGADVIRSLSRPFVAFITAGAKLAEKECREVIRDADYWNAELTAKAIVFTPSLPHVVQACEEPFAVPHARLAPYLTAKGKAELATLQSAK